MSRRWVQVPVILAILALASGCALLLRAPTLQARSAAFEPENMAWSFRHMSELFPSRTVRRAGPVSALESVPTPLDAVVYQVGDEQRVFGEFFERNRTGGLVVLHRGRMVHERYAQGAGPETRFTSWSVAKSFVSTLVGLAVQEGAIESLDDPLERYVAELRGTAYEGVSVRQALQMSSGVEFSEVYAEGDSDVMTFMVDSLITNRKRANEVAAGFPRGRPPGTAFNYNTAETQILGWLVREATGRSPAVYLEEKLWSRLGMEHDATWLLDREGVNGDGMEMSGCCLNASLRDWARFGQLFLQDGIWQGERLLSKGWVSEATTPGAPHLAFGGVEPPSEAGYQYQWWSYSDGSYAAEGVYGQWIWVDPGRQVVIAAASAWPDSWPDAYALEALSAFRAVAAQLSAVTAGRGMRTALA